MDSKIWLSSPHMGGDEIKFIQSAFDANWIAPLGPNVDGFEGDLESYLEQGAKVACLSSGTSALHLSLILAGVKKGDSVLCQSMTFSASANPIMYQNADPIFVDSELETWNMCPVALERAIITEKEKGRKPSAIIVVHLYGMPAKMDQITFIADKYDIPLIEDAAEALGSTFKGQKCGTFGKYGVLSFNGNKIITTSGGGALVTNLESDKKKAIFLGTQARDNAVHYQHSEVGYNYRMSNIAAGIGRGQMKVLDKHVSLRREKNVFYQNIFKSVEGVKVFIEPSKDFYSNHWLSAVIIDETKAGFSNEDLRKELLKDNIESRPLWKPMHLQPVFKDYTYYGNNVCDMLFSKGLCLPSGSNLAEIDLERIVTSINKLIKG